MFTCITSNVNLIMIFEWKLNKHFLETWTIQKLIIDGFSFHKGLYGRVVQFTLVDPGEGIREVVIKKWYSEKYGIYIRIKFIIV